MRLKTMGVRALTATVLFLMLAQVNVWTDTQTHLVLAVGYRAMMLAVPFFMFWGTSQAIRASVLLCLVSTIAGMFALNAFTIGAFALGMAVSGYLAKSVSSHTSEGAADNKVALNIGSLVSGLILMGMSDKAYTLSLAALALGVAVYLSFRVDWNAVDRSSETKSEVSVAAAKKQISFPVLIGWLLVGVATGVKLTGIFTILPQYLIAKQGKLPSWFGFLVVLNSVIVVFAQHRVLKIIDRSKLPLATVFSISAMILLALPAVLHVEHLLLSVLWIALLTVGECALSRYDRTAKETGYLFPKELMVGVGSFVTVVLSRKFTHAIYWSGIVGTICLGLGSLLVYIEKTDSKLATIFSRQDEAAGSAS